MAKNANSLLKNLPVNEISKFTTCINCVSVPHRYTNTHTYTHQDTDIRTEEAHTYFFGFYS